MTEEIARRALGQWWMSNAAIRLVAARENAVYEVNDDSTRFALRLHRQGYRNDRELESELNWMSEIARGGLSVPAPVRAQSGTFLIVLDGIQIDALSWLPGETLADVFPRLSKQKQVELFFDLGQSMARLHQISDTWQPPPGFERVHWNGDGLLGEAPLWDRFWANPALSADDRAVFLKFRDTARARLDRLEGTLDYGLIHADLVPGNVLYDGQNLHVIDFDDGGYGYRLFDISTALLKHMGSPWFAQLQSALIEGYQKIRHLDISEIDLFTALRAATYVGWNISRMAESGGIERNQRFIDTLRRLASEYLAKSR